MPKLRSATSSARANSPSPMPLNRESSPEVLAEASFVRRLYLEQRRTERSRSRFVLMLLESDSLLAAGESADSVDKILRALSDSTRETDSIGWYKDGVVLGIIFAEIGSAEGRTVANALLTKVSGALASTLSIEQISQVSLSFYVFPEDWNEPSHGRPSNSALYPANPGVGPSKATILAKRALDIAGSLFAILVFSPLFLTIAFMVKLSSKGPVLFRQKRVGQFGRQFTFLKFRSMRTETNHSVHEKYVKELISGKNGSHSNAGQKGTVYKLTNDPRVTRVGRFLRRTSLDELPQFFNVLSGDMSLVGPRPPIPYEVKCYDIWHRRRLLAVRPGITGLWQVTGRSKVGFDEMVRLDLRYARSWSLWLDIKILLQTPRAMFSGEGAY